MLPKIALQQAGDGRVEAVLQETVGAQNLAVMGVAVAFASVAGVNKLLDSILAERLPSRSFWLLGLDNCITHPDAIARVMSLKGAQVRVSSGQRGVWIFHPKLYWFSDGRSRSSLILGSANLTAGGLNGNVEAVAAMKAATTAQSQALHAVWNAVWKLGRKITKERLASYRLEFEAMRKARRRAGLLVETSGGTANKKNRAVLASDDARIDPSLATRCWIEVGKITGFKQDQLEIKAEQARFFGWSASGDGDRTISVRLVSGATVEIKAHYFGNHMWRLLLPQVIPEVREGLRLRRGGELLRSNFVAVFLRNGKRFDLRFIDRKSTEFKVLRNASKDAATLGSTTAREYGWV